MQSQAPAGRAARAPLIAAVLALPLLLAPSLSRAQTASPITRPGTPEQRLQRVDDEFAIQRLLTEYAVRLDAHDLEGYLALFAEDGIWQTGSAIRHGRGEIRAMLEVSTATPPSSRSATRHSAWSAISRSS